MSPLRWGIEATHTMPKGKPNATKRSTRTKWTEPRLPSDEIDKMAMGIFKGDFFTDRQIAPEEYESIFRIVFFPLCLQPGNALRQHPPALVGGWMTDTFPRGINGYPMFHKVRLVWQQDAILLIQRYHKIKEAAEAALQA
jgi:hypothetical protein